MSSIKEMVLEDFREAVRLAKCSEELKRSMKTQERVPLFINNLTAQIKHAERVLFRRGKRLDRLKIKMLVQSMTSIFLNNIECKAHEMQMSDAAKTVIKEKQDLLNKFDSDGNIDLTEEMGVKIVDRKENQEEAAPNQ